VDPIRHDGHRIDTVPYKKIRETMFHALTMRTGTAMRAHQECVAAMHIQTSLPVASAVAT
jgi:hypothetical protein